MKKSFGVKPWLLPMPVLMIATYDTNGTVDVMNMAWGGICDDDKVALNLSPGHKTAKNIALKGAFTLSVADAAHMKEADFFGIASGNTMADKFARTGLTATKSEKVDAPIITEFPVTLECTVLESVEVDGTLRVIGQIVDVLIDTATLDESGNPDPRKVGALAVDPFNHGYYVLGEQVGQAWDSGNPLLG